MNPTRLEKILSEDLRLDRVRRSGSNIMACCPSHSETRPSWGISINAPYLHACFSCGYKGSLRTLLLDNNWSIEKIRNLLGAEPISSSALSFGPNDNSSEKASEEELWPFRLEKPAVQYLKGRGLTKDTMRRAGLRYQPLDKRVLFPWYWKGEYLGMTGRAIDDNPVKIEAYGKLAKTNFLYAPLGKLNGREPVILVEGEFDALKVLQEVTANVVAVARGSINQTQLFQLISLPVNSDLVLFFDDDYVGKTLTRHAAKLLRLASFTRAKSVNWALIRDEFPPGTKLDPGVLNRRHMSTLISKATRTVSWQI